METRAALKTKTIRRAGRWRTLAVPLAVSLVVHGAVAAGLAWAWWRMEAGDGLEHEPAPGGEVVLAMKPGEGLTSAPAAASRAEASEATMEVEVRAASEPVETMPRAQASEPSPRGGGVPVVPGGEARSPLLERTLAEAGGPGAAGSAEGGGRNIGVSFAGLSEARARSVVYVVDASGPMVTTLPQVLSLLGRSLSDLTPTQKFGVVLFRDAGAEGGVMVYQPRLVDATPRNQGRLRDWLKGVEPRGRSNPLAGLRAAVALKPQVIFLLTRSIARSQGGQWENGLERTMDELERINPIDPKTGRRTIAIKTIQFLEEDPTGIMGAIAKKHGGGAAETGKASEAYHVLRREELPD